MTVREKFYNMTPMIGNTPLLEICYRYKGEERKVYAKAEYYNMSGSLKDRVAYHILKKAYDEGTIKPGDTIVEATSGNTGISFSAVGRFLGHPVRIYMPNWMSKERIVLMQSYGAEVVLVSREEGGFLGSIELAERSLEEGNVFLPRQFSNEDNSEAHYCSTGEEMVRQLKMLGLKPDGVVAGVGTGGTIMGLKNRLIEENKDLKAFPLEPENSPTLSTGYKVGNHRIQGISDEFIPSLLHLNELSDVISVDDGDSIIMARMIAEKLGISVGISSGANFLGAVLANDMLGKHSVVTTVFADDNKKYLSTDYANPIQMMDHYLSKEIELCSARAIR